MTDKKLIREFIHGLATSKGFEGHFSDDEPLITNGSLDSMDVLTTIFFLEDNFELDFDVTDFDPDNFDTINSITSLVSDYVSVDAFA
jgi:acyl carrier protein